MKKKQSSSSKLRVLWVIILRAIFGIGLCTLFSFLCFLTLLFYANIEMFGFCSKSLPCGAVEISCDVDDIGNARRWLNGQRYFTSDLPEDELLDYFNLNEFDSCWGSGDFALQRRVDDNGEVIYVLCRWSSTPVEH